MRTRYFISLYISFHFEPHELKNAYFGKTKPQWKSKQLEKHWGWGWVSQINTSKYNKPTNGWVWNKKGKNQSHKLAHSGWTGDGNLVPHWLNLAHRCVFSGQHIAVSKCESCVYMSPHFPVCGSHQISIASFQMLKSIWVIISDAESLASLAIGTSSSLLTVGEM